MIGFLIVVGLVVGALVVVALERAGRGRTAVDRLLAISLAAVNSVVLLVVIGFVFGRIEVFVDPALAYALLAFLFPIAIAKFLELERSA